MRTFTFNWTADACSVDCPEYALMLLQPPTSEHDWYLCENHRQWWRGVLSPDPDPVTGVQEILIEMTDRPPQLLLRRLAIIERLS